MRRLLAVLMVGLVALPAAAAPILDGTKDGSYGGAWAVQTVNTQFGDNQSELNAAYAQIDGGVLYLLLTGNLQDNGNRLDIFVDSVAGGQNVLVDDANTPTNDGWGTAFNGFTFDSGFTADYMLIFARPNATSASVHLATIGGGAAAFETGTNIFSGASTGTNANALPIAGVGVSYDNSNVAGVSGGTGAANQANALAVTTGLELAISLSAIGNPNPADIMVSAMVNNGSHTFLSNQFLGGLPAGQDNLGGAGATSTHNMNNFAGDQFFKVVPEPSSVALAGLALVGFAGCLRRRFGSL